MKTICVILAGGKSSRMGRDKAMLPFGGQTFLSRLIEEYAPEFPIYVSVGQPGKFPHTGAGELVDLRPGMGPLAGLEAAFLQTDADAVFLTAADLPFGSLELAKRLCRECSHADASVIIREDGSLEPAFAVYRRSCLPVLQRLLDEDRRTFRGIFRRVQTRYVPESELSEFPMDQILQNINTPEAYEKNILHSP